MPAVVLRHPNLPGQPVIVDVPVGGYVPAQYRDAGWVIDPKTSLADAADEAQTTREKAADAAAKKAAAFVPGFAPNEPPAALAPEIPAPVSDPAPAGSDPKEN